MTSLIEHAQGALAGLAVGDVLGTPAEGLDPSQIAERWGRIEGFVAEFPMGSDDTEYALLTAKALLEHGTSFDARAAAQLWIDHVIYQDGKFGGGGFSEMSTIRNLQKGLLPPQSGQHNHAWSDGLAMRVAPIGVVAAGNPRLAADLAYQDGIVSHSEEGVYAGQAVAAAVAVAMTGADPHQAHEVAMSVVPQDSWTWRGLRDCREIVATTSGWQETARNAVDHFALRDYYWTDLATEAVPLAFTALLASGGDVRESILNAVNLGRDADTIAAIAGGVIGAYGGIGSIPAEWLPAITTAPGVCLRVTKGMNPMQVATDLAALVPEFAAAHATSV